MKREDLKLLELKWKGAAVGVADDGEARPVRLSVGWEGWREHMQASEIWRSCACGRSGRSGRYHPAKSARRGLTRAGSSLHPNAARQARAARQP